MTVVVFASVLAGLSLKAVLISGATVLATTLVAGYLVDLNAVSPHYFYRDRIAET